MTELLINPTSSIGATWPPVEAPHERMRGFYDQAVGSLTEVSTFLDEFEHYRKEAEALQNISRLSIRVLIDKGLVNNLKQRDILLEGALPIDEDLCVLYTASNSLQRKVPDAILKSHQTLLDSVTQHAIRTDRPSALKALNLESSVIDNDTTPAERNALISKFLELYEMFGYDEQDVHDLLFNDSNIIVYAEDEKGIVSTAMAEQATIPIEGYGDLRITEITEAATRPSDRGKGFYTAVSADLIDTLRGQIQTPPDVIYGECNLAMRGVIVAAHLNGRKFSFYDQSLLGVNQPYFGILRQNFKVEDNTEQRTYNDFALSYFPK